MSSFVISKHEFVAAAGFCAAAAEHLNYYREPCLRVWNKRNNRVSTADDIRADFVRLYELNAKSVALQYDEEIETDSNTYDNVFSDFKGKSSHLFNRGYTFERDTDRRCLQKTIYGLLRFFDCIKYQIEDDDCARRALNILNKYYRAIPAILRRLDSVHDEQLSDYWGEFKLAE